MLVVRQRLYEDAVGMLGGYVSMLPLKQDPSKPRTKAKPAGSGWAGSLSVPSAAEQVAQDLIDLRLEVGEHPRSLSFGLEAGSHRATNMHLHPPLPPSFFTPLYLRTSLSLAICAARAGLCPGSCPGAGAHASVANLAAIIARCSCEWPPCALSHAFPLLPFPPPHTATFPEAGMPPMPEGFEYIEPGVAPDSSPEAQVATLAGLSLCGFCPASLCKSGLLLPAKPQLGLIRASATGMLFGFASARGLAEFVAQGPEAAIEAIDKAVVQRPILGKVLGRTASVHPTLSLQVRLLV
jgi:hypothetical protein